MRTNRWAAAVAAVCLLAAASLAIADGSDEARAKVEKKVHAILQHAEELDARGSHDDARELRQKAHEMMQALHRKLEGAERAAPDRPKRMPGDDDLREILAGLKAGMRALEHLGRREQAGQLERVAGDVHRELAQREQARQRDHARDPRNDQMNLLEQVIQDLNRRGNERQAAAVLEAARHLAESRRSDEGAEREAHRRAMERLERLEVRLAELERQVRELREMVARGRR